MDKAYKVWDEQVKPVVADNQREVMEMQMRLLTARRAHANKKNAATEYRKAIEDYTSVVKRSENKDKPLYVPEFDLLATALTGLGHLRLVCTFDGPFVCLFSYYSLFNRNLGGASMVQTTKRQQSTLRLCVCFTVKH